MEVVQASDQGLAALADRAIATYAAYERGVEEWYELDAKAGEMLKGIKYARGDANDLRVVKALESSALGGPCQEVEAVSQTTSKNDEGRLARAARFIS